MSSEVEGVQGHLGGGFTDGLSGNDTDVLTGVDLASQTLQPHQQLEAVGVHLSLSFLDLVLGGVVEEDLVGVTLAVGLELLLELLADGTDVSADAQLVGDGVGKAEADDRDADAVLTVEDDGGNALDLLLGVGVHDIVLDDVVLGSDVHNHSRSELSADVADLPLALGVDELAGLDDGALLVEVDLALLHGGLLLLELLAHDLSLLVLGDALVHVETGVLEEVVVDAELVHEGLVVAGEEGELAVGTLHILGLGDIDAIVTVDELDDETVAVADGVIVLDAEVLEVLADASLEVAGSGGLDGGIDQTFSSSHGVEVVLLRADAGKETVRDEATGSGTQIVGGERGAGLSGGHQGDTTTLELLLTETARDLGVVDDGTLGTGLDHAGETVLGEVENQTVGQAGLNDLGGDGGHDRLHVVIELDTEGAVGGNVLSSDLFTNAVHLLLEGEVLELLLHLELLLQTGDGSLEGVVDDLLSLFFGGGLENQIVHAAGEAVLLEVVGEEATQAGEQVAGHIGTVDFVDTMNHGVGGCTEQTLIEDAAEELVVLNEDHLLAELGTSDVLSLTPGLVADLGLALVVEGGEGADEVVEDRGDELLAGPERVGLVDAGRDDVDELGGLALVEAADGDVEQLLVLLAGQEGVSLGQEEAGGDVVLQGEIAEGPDTWMRPRRGEPSLAETY